MKVDIGSVFGTLTALTKPKTRGGKHSFCIFQCLCGVVKEIRTDGVTSRKVISCGCIRTRLFVARNTTHGMTPRSSCPPEYRTWADMIQRCTNPNQATYKFYGARGVTVCDRWRDFGVFYSDMGARPEGTSIERIDNNKGYEPGNCRWATHYEQMQNTRQTARVLVGDRVMSARLAARALGISEHAIYRRVYKYGETHQQAVDHILSV